MEHRAVARSLYRNNAIRLYFYVIALSLHKEYNIVPVTWCKMLFTSVSNIQKYEKIKIIVIQCISDFFNVN